MKFFKKTVLAIFLFSFVMGLTGCYTSLEKESKLIKQIETYYPNTQFVGSEKKNTKILIYGKEEVEVKVYTFKNDEFEFEVYNYIEDMHGWKSEVISSNYYEKVVALKRDEIDKIIENFSIPAILDESYGTMNNTGGNHKEVEKFLEIESERCIFEIPQPSIDNDVFCFKFLIQDEVGIEECIGFLENFYDIMKPYMPEKENKMFTEKVRIEFSASVFPDGIPFMGYAETFVRIDDLPFVIGGLDFDAITNKVKEAYFAA